MISLDRVLKSRNITLPTKVHIVKAMIFPVVMNGCESWTVELWQNAKQLMLLNYGAENTPESPLDSKEIKSVKLKGNQP